MRAQKVTTVGGEDILVIAEDGDELIEGAPELKPTTIIEYFPAPDDESEELTGDGSGEALPEIPEHSYEPDATPLDG